MTNPLNYLRSAQGQLLDRAEYMKHDYPRYAENLIGVLGEAKASKKFVLPKGGRIFDTELRALPELLRLPFPSIVVEYEAGTGASVAEQIFGADASQEFPKRIAYAQEADDGWIDVVVFCGNRDGVWGMLPYFASVSNQVDGAIADSEILEKTDAIQVSGIVSCMHKIGEVADEIDDWELRARVDTLDEVNAVLALVEALSCINVNSEPITPRKVSKSSKKRGAIEFDEYHVLTVTIGESNATRSACGAGGVRSPREHLRRGHIRRISDGRRVWVNSCVVAAGSAGKISADYRVRGEVLT